jgi:hypothetical protein
LNSEEPVHAFVSALVLFQLNFGDLVRGIPHDAGAVVAYIIFIAFAYAIWRGSKTQPDKAEGDKAGPEKTG